MCRLLLAICFIAAFACASGKRQVPLPSPPAPSPPPPGASPAPAATYNAPGIQFSVDIAGFIESSFGTAQRTVFCGRLQNATSPFSSTCSIGSVTTTSNSYPGVVTVAGILSYNLYDPDQNTLFAATASRDILVQSLTNNATAVLAPLTATKNCDCLGPNSAPAINTPTAFSYASPNGLEITAMAGARCGARLAYPSTGNLGDVIGINNGAANIADKFKFCSNPAIVGGTTGSPGTAPCVKYGVTNAYSSRATVGSPTVAGGQLTAVTIRTGGAGYASSQAAAISLTVTAGTAALVPGPSDCKVTSVTGAGPFTVLLQDGTGGTCQFSAAGSGYDQANPPTFTITERTNTLTGCVLPSTLVAANDGTATAGQITTTASSLAGISFQCAAGTALAAGNDVIFSALSSPPASTAPTVTPVIQGGQITALTVGTQGPAYGPVTITMPAPTSTSSGQFCTNTGNIAGANPTNFILEATGAPAATGTCVFMGADTGEQKVCGTPVPPSGIAGTPGKGSCSVQNSWIAQCNGGLNSCPSSTTFSCGILPQSFITNRTPAPPAPAPAPTPSPAPMPAPTPAPMPAPSPAPMPSPPAPLVCTYRGIYEIIPLYAPCNRYRIASGTDSDCDYNLVTLRTAGQVGQGKIARLHWEFATIAEDNLSVPTNVLARARRGCTNRFLAAPSDPTTLKTGGSSWKWQFVPFPGSSNCEEVNVISQNRLSTTAFLQVPNTCDRFRYNATDGGRQRFRLRKITL
ncbi:hypothetical protein M9435_006773 [Picochlorum sp. BPE23]|nr:hypothetical protein M9435_006773 [Picochlorum sp. BPE23]